MPNLQTLLTAGQVENMQLSCQLYVTCTSLKFPFRELKKQCPSTAFAKDFRGYTAWAGQSLSSPGGLAEKKGNGGGSDASPSASDPSAQSLQSCCTFWQQESSTCPNSHSGGCCMFFFHLAQHFLHVSFACTKDEICEVPQVGRSIIFWSLAQKQVSATKLPSRFRTSSSTRRGI